MTSLDASTLHIDVPRRMAGVRFDHALAELIPHRTRAQLQKLVRRGRVKLDDRKVVRSNFKLRGGERLLVHLVDPNAARVLELEFLHVEDEFAVVNKPPGMLNHPTERLAGGTLAELLVAEFGPLPSVDDAVRPGIVHRLDRETSGVMVVARTQSALDRLRSQFRARSVEKHYQALVHGVPRETTFRVDLALAATPGNPDLQRVDPRGRSASTVFEVERSWNDFSLLACRPRTGRRHQLRVHLFSVGHPVVADQLYRPESGRIRGPGHHALHARRLAFDHPRSGERLEFEVAPPSSFASFVESLGD